MKTIKKTSLLAAAIYFAALISASTALASPPSPDSDPNCGGNCQVICINGCDQNPVTDPAWNKPVQPNSTYSVYSYQQARCVWARNGWDKNLGALAEQFTLDTKTNTWSCMDGYNCDFGPCGLNGTRPCNTAIDTFCVPCAVPGQSLGSDGKCH